MQSTIHVIGHSCRSLAESLVRAGYKVIAFDDYLDRDLAAIAECYSIDQFDHFPRDATGNSRPMIMLAGGMENRIGLLRKIDERFEVLGPRIEAIIALRDIRAITDMARRANIGFPDVDELDNAAVLGANTTWIWKPFRSGGGQSITHLIEDRPRTASKDGYWQKFIPGRSISVTWLLRENNAEVLAICGSLSASDWAGPTEFGYRGSLNGFELDKDQNQRLTVLGDIVRERFEYRGLLQADFVLDNDGQLWLLEFNPRWAASFEVIERALNQNLASLHISAMQNVLPRDERYSRHMQSGIHGKAIVYAPTTIFIDQATSDWLFTCCEGYDSTLEASVIAADVPRANTTCHAGQPIVSLLAHAPNKIELLDVLHQAQAHLLKLLGC
jgi:uncharacterized protein